MGKRRRNKNKKNDKNSVQNDDCKRIKSDEINQVKVPENKSPRETFESFIGPTNFDDFFTNYWEQKPMLIHRSEPQKSPLFSRQIFETLLQTSKHKIQFGRDVNVVKFDRAKKERNDPSVQGKVVLAKFKKLLDVDKATMQIHQPQRFQESLWHLMERLECFFGCLVGSNVYITPPDAQGLPPHHDDVEVFIVQLEGEKRWRLYPPKTQLASEYSGDFKTEDIGEPILDFVLKPGDLLYFPRGTIHQAETSTTLSSHITISTYQHFSVGDYLLSVFPQMLTEAAVKNVDFRRGLPINFISDSPNIKSHLTSIIESLLPKIKCKSNHVPDGLIADFMTNRLPPFGVDPLQLRDSLPQGKPPNKSSQVKLKYPDHISVVVKDDDNEDESMSNSSEDHDGAIVPSTSSEKMVFLYYSVMNDRHHHMMKGPQSADQVDNNELGASPALKFPLRFLEPINFLRSNCERFVSSSELPSCKDDDIETFLTALWSIHLLEIKP